MKSGKAKPTNNKNLLKKCEPMKKKLKVSNYEK